MNAVSLFRGDCRDWLNAAGSNSIDSIVTDPPYELGFMGKGWDSAGIAYDVKMWEQCLRVLKPGGHLLAFGGTRTYHRMAVAIEDAGFEIRDSIHWTYGSGFPKSLDVSKAIDKALGAEREIVGQDAGWNKTYNPDQFDITASATDAAKRWEGWGTALKPSHELIVVARKPLSGSVAANVQEWGTGALNIDGCRVGRAAGDVSHAGRRTATFGTQQTVSGGDGSGGWAQNASGRWPANTIFTHSWGCADECVEGCPCKELDEQSGHSTSRVGKPRGTTKKGLFANSKVNKVGREHNDPGGASRFFTQTAYDEADFPTALYYAKAATSEREDGLGGGKERANHHPTVKPVALMRHLVRLVTPPNGIVLDPFLGSGTAAAAAILEGVEWVGCEITPEYWPIIEARVQNATEAAAYRLFPL